MCGQTVDFRVLLDSSARNPLYSLSMLRAGRAQTRPRTEYAQRRSSSISGNDIPRGASSSLHSIAAGTCFQKALYVDLRSDFEGFESIARAMTMYFRSLARD